MHLLSSNNNPKIIVYQFFNMNSYSCINWLYECGFLCQNWKNEFLRGYFWKFCKADHCVMPNRPSLSYTPKKWGHLGSAGRMVKNLRFSLSIHIFPEVNLMAYFWLPSYWFKFKFWGSALPLWLKWEWKLAFLGWKQTCRAHVHFSNVASYN